MASWDSYLENVQSTPPKRALKEKVRDLFKSMQMETPAAAVGMTVAMLDGSGKLPMTDPAVGALARTAITALEQAQLAQRAGGQQASGSAESGSASALGVASSIVSPKVAVNCKAKLQAKDLGALPFTSVVDQGIWDRMAAENEAAKLAGRPAFTYVDLTAKELSPLWLTPESIGGKVAGEEHMDASAPLTKLADLQRALKGAMETTRFFRTYAQW